MVELAGVVPVAGVGPVVVLAVVVDVSMDGVVVAEESDVVVVPVVVAEGKPPNIPGGILMLPVAPPILKHRHTKD